MPLEEETELLEDATGDGGDGNAGGCGDGDNDDCGDGDDDGCDDGDDDGCCDCDYDGGDDDDHGNITVDVDTAAASAAAAAAAARSGDSVHLLCGWPFPMVAVQQAAYKVFGLLTDALPPGLVKVEAVI